MTNERQSKRIEENNLHGITGVIRRPVALLEPPSTPQNEVWRYEVGYPFQATSTIAGLFTHITILGTSYDGYNNGWDAFLFDDLSNIKAGKAYPVTRNEYRVNPVSGEKQLLLKSPGSGGFVPLDARRPDGSVHPHAGTGFGCGQAHFFPPKGDGFSWGDSGRLDMLEILQFNYDGQIFSSIRSSLTTQNIDFPYIIADSDWCICNHGMSNAIPDGDDLLYAVTAFKNSSNVASNGISRWISLEGIWKPVSFTPVTGLDPVQKPLTAKYVRAIHENIHWMESSLTRDVDGSLLFCARGSDTHRDERAYDYGCLVRVWRSTDGGNTWEIIIDLPEVRYLSPISINRAVDGTPYLVSNPFRPSFIKGAKTGRGREDLHLWPLNTDRSGLDPAIIVRESLKEFGQPPSSPNTNQIGSWWTDHPSAAVVRLKDGQWHNLLAYRVVHGPLLGIDPLPSFGCYVDEVVSQGKSISEWNFQR